MPEQAAISKFACPACGGEANWNPALQKLVCPFCGTESATKPDAATDGIVEHDLVEALHGSGDVARGWNAGKRQVKCLSCNAISVFDQARQAQNCEFCGSAQLVPYDEVAPAFRPESLWPFVVSESAARDGIRKWYGRLWLAPNALKRRALTDTVKGIYLPYWTFHAHADARWTADAGHYYYTTETYSEGGQIRTRQVRQVRWVPAAGQLAHFFGDDLVCASVGVHPRLLRGVEPFPSASLRNYDSGYFAGWVVERYQIDLAAAARQAREEMDAKLRDACAQAVPGDTYRNLVVDAAYTRQTFKHVLAPVWLMTYKYGAKSFQCVQNGVTGAIQGEYPKSPWKIALIVIALFVAVVIVMALGGR